MRLVDIVAPPRRGSAGQSGAAVHNKKDASHALAMLFGRLCHFSTITVDGRRRSVQGSGAVIWPPAKDERARHAAGRRTRGARTIGLGWHIAVARRARGGNRAGDSSCRSGRYLSTLALGRGRPPSSPFGRRSRSPTCAPSARARTRRGPFSPWSIGAREVTGRRERRVSGKTDDSAEDAGGRSSATRSPPRRKLLTIDVNCVAVGRWRRGVQLCRRLWRAPRDPLYHVDGTLVHRVQGAQTNRRARWRDARRPAHHQRLA